MTAKYTAKVRSELLSMLRDERRQERCELCKALKKEGDELVKQHDKEIRELRVDLEELEADRSKILKNAKLYEFDGPRRGECATDVLHQKLIEFDKETDKNIKELLKS